MRRGLPQRQSGHACGRWPAICRGGLPDEQWAALPGCGDWYAKMPAACKKAEGPSPGNEQDACLEYLQRTQPADICSGYALMRSTGAPQSAIDEVFGIPSCSGQTRPASEAAAPSSTAQLAPAGGSKIKPWMILAGAAVAGVVVWKLVK